MSDRSIAGYCPMGCGETLFVGSGGYVTCSLIGCPRPTAVAELLDDRETEHLVDFGEGGFTIKHPLRERLNDGLVKCVLREYVADQCLTGPPVRPGWYRACERDGRWSWEPLTSATSPERGESGV